MSAKRKRPRKKKNLARKRRRKNHGPSTTTTATTTTTVTSTTTTTTSTTITTIRDMPSEMWKQIVQCLNTGSDLSRTALVAGDHWLPYWARSELKKWKVKHVDWMLSILCDKHDDEVETRTKKGLLFYLDSIREKNMGKRISSRNALLEVLPHRKEDPFRMAEVFMNVVKTLFRVFYKVKKSETELHLSTGNYAQRLRGNHELVVAGHIPLTTVTAYLCSREGVKIVRLVVTCDAQARYENLTTLASHIHEFALALGFDVQYLCRTIRGTWDDDVEDEDYDDDDEEEESEEEESEEEEQCNLCGPVECLCKFCRHCNFELRDCACVCVMCFTCGLEREECTCRVVFMDE